MMMRITQEIKVPDESVQIIIMKRDGLTLELQAHQVGVSIAKYDAELSGKRYLLHGIFKIGFTTDDLAGWLNHFENAQAQFKFPIIEDDEGRRFFIVQDNNGTLLQFFASGG